MRKYLFICGLFIMTSFFFTRSGMNAEARDGGGRNDDRIVVEAWEDDEPSARLDQSITEADLRTAVKIAPSNPEPHMKLGLLLRDRDKRREALREFHFVERLRPHNLSAIYYSGLTFKEMNSCGNAVQHLNRFLKAPQSAAFPRKKEKAASIIEECGGDRPGRARHVARRK